MRAPTSNVSAQRFHFIRHLEIWINFIDTRRGIIWIAAINQHFTNSTYSESIQISSWFEWFKSWNQSATQIELPRIKENWHLRWWMEVATYWGCRKQVWAVAGREWHGECANPRPNLPGRSSSQICEKPPHTQSNTSTLYPHIHTYKHRSIYLYISMEKRSPGLCQSTQLPFQSIIV